MNIYEMYVENGNVAGFWIKHDSWGLGTSARVLSIGGISFGKLQYKSSELNGAHVLCEFYLQGVLQNSSQLLSDADSELFRRIDGLDGVIY